MVACCAKPATRVGIVGLGLIGGSLLRGLSDQGKVAVAGFDADAAVQTSAKAAGFEVHESATELAQASDIAIVAVPPKRTAETVISTLQASPTVVVADAASVKGPISRWVSRYHPEIRHRFLPAHPLAGAETTGWASAGEHVLQQSVWALCPYNDTSAEVLEHLARVIDCLGGRIVCCAPDDHDDAVARTSHVPHIVAQALAHVVGRGRARGLRASLSGGGFRDATRIAKSDPSLWGEILTLNASSSVAVLRELSDELRTWSDAVECGDEAELTATWSEGGRFRRAVDDVRWDAQDWIPQVDGWPAWDHLIALGLQGRAVRKLRFDAERMLHYEVTRPLRLRGSDSPGRQRDYRS